MASADPGAGAALPWRLGLLLLALTVSAYANHFQNGFHFDDSHVIVDNDAVRTLADPTRFFTDPETKSTLPTNRAYRPLLMVTFAVDYALGGGLDPFYFHLSTFLWFLIQGGLMYLLFLRVFDGSKTHRWNPVTAALAVGLFWVHTANAETINYVSARSDSLSTLCVVAGLTLHAFGRRWVAVVPVALGMLIKPTALMYVPIVTVYALSFDERLGARDVIEDPREVMTALRRVARWMVPQALLLTALFWLTFAMTPDTWDLGGPGRWRYAITQPWVVLRYFWTFLVPLGLTADTDWEAFASWLDFRFFVGVGFIALAMAAAVVASLRRETRPIAFGIAFFFFALVPSSSVVPLAEVTNDHRMFFPFVGLTLATTWAGALWLMRHEEAWRRSLPVRVTGVALAGLVLSGHAVGVHQRNQVWRSSETLWADVVEKSPRNGRAMMNFGLTLMRRGDYESAEDWFTRALDTGYRAHPYLQVNLAIVNRSLGRPEQARRYYEESLRLGGRNPAVQYYYGLWREAEGDFREALRYADLALAASPNYAAAAELRNRVRFRALPLDEALAAVDQDATVDDLIALSLRSYQAERYEDCIRLCRLALQLDPGSAAAHNNICAASNVLGRWDDAIEACEAALRIEPDHELAANNLAWARRQLGLAQRR